MQMKDPIGKRFLMYDEGYAGEIIGVVKDYHFQSLTNDIGPIMITTMKWRWSNVFIKVNPNNVHASLQYIEDTYKKFAPSFPFEFSFLDEDIDQTYSQYYEMGTIIKYFSILSSIYFLSWFIWISIVYDRATYQRDRDQKSFGFISLQNRFPAYSGIFQVGATG